MQSERREILYRKYQAGMFSQRNYSHVNVLPQLEPKCKQIDYKNLKELLRIKHNNKKQISNPILSFDFRGLSGNPKKMNIIKPIRLPQLQNQVMQVPHSPKYYVKPLKVRTELIKNNTDVIDRMNKWSQTTLDEDKLLEYLNQ